MKTLNAIVTLYADEESVEELTAVIRTVIYGNESMTDEEQARAILAEFRKIAEGTCCERP